VEPIKYSRLLKRLLGLAAVLPILAVGTQASSLASKLSFRLTPGGMFALGGHYDDTSKLKDIISLGPGLGVGLRYEVNENFYLDAGYSYAVLPVKTGQKPFDFRHSKSYFDMSSMTLNAVLFLKSGFQMEPYLTIGGGIYPWKFCEKMFDGKVWNAPGKPQNRFSDSSLGLSVGLGVEVFALVHLSVITEFRYLYLFSRNPAKFGTDDFTQQTFLGASIGIIYYLSKK
jgi:opacity protein-like surface antigen